ncbi:MAG TPA: monovalent cation/H(+) antiporter subunit G [Candidatus Limnocylindrales bacterium]|jgi:multicomponent Na+:H+ antiporter subunit G|nr:monovalent cation/H(+) antiporter subunit G [Candidatus Limnocylindrales bacterium]
MIHIIVSLLVAIGTTFMLLAAIGVVRMPDVYMRLQVSTKGASLGAGCVLLAVPLFFADLAIGVRALLIIVFIFLTTPISAHMLGRAAYIVGVPLWEGSVMDDLAGKYDRETQELASPDVEEGPSGIA